MNCVGYNVSLEEVKAIELLLLKEFDRVCRENNLKYFADAGTLLGAARHQGFIPWDDDIDVVMFRDDYDKLMKIGSSQFTAPYFFQSAYTDKEYIRSHIQIRMDGTLAAIPYEKDKVKFHQGIFMDVFPLDNIPENSFEARWQWMEIQFYKRFMAALYGADSGNNKIKTAIRTMIRWIFLKKSNLEKIYSHFENCCKKYNGTSDTVTTLSFNSRYRQQLFKQNWYVKTIYLKFGNITIPAPSNYAKVLEVRYGDWKTPINTGTLHGELIFQIDETSEKLVTENLSD